MQALRDDVLDDAVVGVGMRSQVAYDAQDQHVKAFVHVIDADFVQPSVVLDCCRRGRQDAWKQRLLC